MIKQTGQIGLTGVQPVQSRLMGEAVNAMAKVSPDQSREQFIFLAAYEATAGATPVLTNGADCLEAEAETVITGAPAEQEDTDAETQSPLSFDPTVEQQTEPVDPTIGHVSNAPLQADLSSAIPDAPEANRFQALTPHLTPQVVRDVVNGADPSDTEIMALSEPTSVGIAQSTMNARPEPSPLLGKPLTSRGPVTAPVVPASDSRGPATQSVVKTAMDTGTLDPAGSKTNAVQSQPSLGSSQILGTIPVDLPDQSVTPEQMATAPAPEALQSNLQTTLVPTLPSTKADAGHQHPFVAPHDAGQTGQIDKAGSALKISTSRVAAQTPDDPSPKPSDTFIERAAVPVDRPQQPTQASIVETGNRTSHAIEGAAKAQHLTQTLVPATMAPPTPPQRANQHAPQKLESADKNATQKAPPPVVQPDAINVAGRAMGHDSPLSTPNNSGMGHEFVTHLVDLADIPSRAQPLVAQGRPMMPPPAQITIQLADAAAQSQSGPIEMTLTPVELGRVRMSLTIQDGAVNVVILADRPETADMLRRHTDILAQDFRALGFDTASFTFADQNQQPKQPVLPEADMRHDMAVAPDTPAAQLPALHVPSDRLDIRL